MTYIYAQYSMINITEAIVKWNGGVNAPSSRNASAGTEGRGRGRVYGRGLARQAGSSGMVDRRGWAR